MTNHISLVNPYRVEVRGTREGAGWIPVLDVNAKDRRAIASILRAQGYRWVAPGKAGSREWRVIPNPDAPVAVLTVTPAGAR